MPHGRIGGILAALIVASTSAAPAAPTCYAERDLLRQAVRVVVGSYKCPGFKDAIYGVAYAVFMRESGAIDHSTGPCESELAAAREAASLELLKERAPFCAAVADAIATDDRIKRAVAAAGVM